MDSSYHGYQRFVPLNHEAEASDVDASETYPWGDKERDGNCDGRSFENPEDDYPSEDCDVEGDTPQSHDDDDTESYDAQVKDTVSDMEDAGSWDHPQRDGSWDDEAQSPNTDNASYLKQSDNQPGYPEQPGVDNTEHPSWEDHRVFSSQHTIGQTQYWNFSGIGLRASQQSGKEPDTENASGSVDQTIDNGLEQAHDMSSAEDDNQDDVNEEPSDFTDADPLPVGLPLSNQRSIRVIKTEPLDRTFENFEPSLDENMEEPAEGDMPYTDESGLLRANHDDLPSDRHSCTVCGRSFTNAKSHLSHMRIHSSQKPYECKECGERFRIRETLKSHGLKMHAGIKPYKCQQCPSEYFHKKTLNRHQRTTGHTGICVSMFKDVASKKVAEGKYPFGKEYKCQQCPSEYYHKRALTRHQKNTGHTGNLFDDMASKKVAEEKYPFSKEAKKPDNMMNNKTKEFPLGYAITSTFMHSSFQGDMTLDDCSSKSYSDITSPTDVGGSHQDSQDMSTPDGELLSHTVEDSELSINDRSHLRLRIHSGETPYECEECGERFHLKETLKSHGLKMHVALKPYKCQQCPSEYFQKKNLSRHQKATGHTGMYIYVSSLFEDMARNAAEATYPLGKEAKQIDNMINNKAQEFQFGDGITSTVEHSSSQEGVTLDDSSSKLCSEVMSTDVGGSHQDSQGMSLREAGLFSSIVEHSEPPINDRTHVCIQSGENPYECEECGERFQLKATLKSHGLKMHAALKPYKCQQCPSEYVQKKKLSRHQKTTGHTGMYIYVSSLFEDMARNNAADEKYPFSTSTDVGGSDQDSQGISIPEGGLFSPAIEHSESSINDRSHMRIHSGETPYECKECGERFQLKETLKSHVLKMHAALKPYRCQQCPSEYFEKKNLNRHQRTTGHTGIHVSILFEDMASNKAAEVKYPFGKEYKCQQCSSEYHHKRTLTRHQKKTGHTGTCVGRFFDNMANTKAEKEVPTQQGDQKS